MLRMTIVFLMGLVMHSASGEEVFSIDVERIKQVALDAALVEYPELLPGDLEDRTNGVVTLICFPRDSGYKCHAKQSFKVLSSAQEDIVREGDTCSQRTEYNMVSVAVLPDGSISRIYTSGGNTSTKPIDCPADIDDKGLDPGLMSSES